MVSNRKIAIITGAGSGIGRATALVFLNSGYQVVFAGRHRETLESTIKDSGENAIWAQAVPTDVRDEHSVERLFSEIREKFGRVDVVFNNAGIIGPLATLEETTFNQWKDVIDTNLTGMFLCIREAFRVMKSQDPRGGRIINNGSISAHVPRPDSIAYTAAKHGVTGLTKSASLDGRKYDIACSQIDVGNATTNIASRFSRGIKQADGSVKAEPMIDVDEVARAVLYIANLPLDTNVQFMTVMATKMPYIGRG